MIRNIQIKIIYLYIKHHLNMKEENKLQLIIKHIKTMFYNLIVFYF